jgi:HK97 family phage major capsid protein
MTSIFELKQQYKAELDEAELHADNVDPAQMNAYAQAMNRARQIHAQINEHESNPRSIRAVFPSGRPGLGLEGAPDTPAAGAPRTPTLTHLSSEYVDAFRAYVSSNGQKQLASLYEGAGSSGGFAVPVIVEGQVVPLAPTDMGVRSIASVIPTSSDIKIPVATTISTAAGKLEGDGTGSHLFQESEPTLAQFTLSAFMMGVLHQISWELAQDVPSFQSFAVADMLLAAQLYEENLFVNGTGTNQAQGLVGNVGAGVTGVAAGSDHYASELLSATFDVQSTLKTAYHQNAGWLMSRATATVIKKQQSQSNLFTPVWTRENGKDFLHGYPVTFSTAMPAIGAASTPVLFGDFGTGYVIGDRGGSGLNVKILDQPKAAEGIVQLLCYRRSDGRVRRSEAIQAISLT